MQGRIVYNIGPTIGGYRTKKSTWTETSDQYNQIGQFIAPWATFQSMWQQLFHPSCPHFWAIFEKLSKSFIFLAEIIFGQLL